MDLRDKILHAAVRVFAEVGFRGATTRRIAQEAGVNEITLFRHFGSKEKLLHEAIARSDLAPKGPELPAEPKRPRAELLAWSRDHFNHLHEMRALLCTCMAEMHEHPEIAPRQNRTTEAVAMLRDYLRKLRARGFTSAAFDPDIVAPAFMGMLFSDILGRQFMPDMYARKPQKTLEGYVDFLLQGIGVEKQALRQEKAS